MEHNQLKESKVSELIDEQQDLTGASEKLVKLNNLKGKITQKVATAAKEHKFFEENVVWFKVATVSLMKIMYF